MWLDLTTRHRQTWLFSSTSTYHSTDLLTARGVAHLVSPQNKWLDQLRNDSTRPTGELWRRAVDCRHGGATTQRPSPAARTWWWWWWWTELNWPATSQPSYTTRWLDWLRQNWDGWCSASSLWTPPLESMCSQLQFANSRVQFACCGQAFIVTEIYTVAANLRPLIITNSLRRSQIHLCPAHFPATCLR